MKCENCGDESKYRQHENPMHCINHLAQRVEVLELEAANARNHAAEMREHLAKMGTDRNDAEARARAFKAAAWKRRRCEEALRFIGGADWYADAERKKMFVTKETFDRMNALIEKALPEDAQGDAGTFKEAEDGA